MREAACLIQIILFQTHIGANIAKHEADQELVAIFLLCLLIIWAFFLAVHFEIELCSSSRGIHSCTHIALLVLW